MVEAWITGEPTARSFVQQAGMEEAYDLLKTPYRREHYKRSVTQDEYIITYLILLY